MTIGEKIKRVRKFRKMTQAELGTAVGLGENAQKIAAPKGKRRKQRFAEAGEIFTQLHYFLSFMPRISL